MVKHSPIGASGAYRWFECPGSVNLIKKAPPQEDNVFAMQGTAAHWALELSLARNEDPMHFEGVIAPNGVELTEEDVRAVSEAATRVREIMATGDWEMLLEVSVELKRVHPDLFGTADVVLYKKDFSKLIVIDYKHGKGVPVYAKNNKQLMYYALGVVNFLGKDYIDVMNWGNVFKSVKVEIIQPRFFHNDPDALKWEVPAEKLNSFADELKEKAEATGNKDAGLKAGDHCRFCPALAICPGFSTHAQDVAKVDFQPISSSANLKMPEVKTMQEADLAKVMRFAPIIKEWLDQVNTHAQGLLQQGKTIEGYKLVSKRANRRWTEGAEHKLLDMFTPEELYKQTLRSPKQMEDHLGKEEKGKLAELIYKPDAGTTIAPEYDRRKAVDYKSDFKAIEQGE